MEEADSWDLGRVNNPVAVHAPRKLVGVGLAEDREVDLRLAEGRAQRSANADRQYERVQKLRHEQRLG